jgi:cytochrome b involved in lipid metabolism
MAADKLIQASEIRRHDSASDLWIVVNGAVWDMTDYADRHPGGAAGEIRRIAPQQRSKLAIQ